MSPFVIFALPRSRTKWLAEFLGLGHDLAIDSTSVEDFVARLGKGSVETGAVVGVEELRRRVPYVRLCVVLRPFQDVLASLREQKIPHDAADLWGKYTMMMELVATGAAPAVPFVELEKVSVCSALYQACHGELPPVGRWESFARRNIQVDVKATLEKLARNRANIERMKDACTTPQLAQEGWLDIWPEVQTLADAHFEEVDGGIELKRPFKIDSLRMAQCETAGVLKIFTARLRGRLIGYVTWNVTMDLESEGLLIAQQGAWYASPEHTVGVRLFRFSAAALKSMGVKLLFPHHRLQGRGKDLGKFFTRMGAKPTQMTYSLWIGEDNAEC